MDILQTTRAAAQDERFAPALNAAQDELSDVAPEQVAELIKLLEFALQNPDRYAEVLRAAVADDMVEPGDLPEQFDAQVIMAALVVLYKLQEQPAPEQLAMRRGGLARMRTLAARGRLGDTMLAHISPEEAALLKARGGAGTLNPNTGLPQYFSLKKLFKAVLPIALNFIAPGIGTAIGTALGATGATAAMLGQAVIGGATAGLTGGNVLQGAVLGGLGGGLGSAAGSAASDALGLGLGQTGQQLLGGALVGGVAGAATGQGFGKGALMGAAGAGLGAATQGVGLGALGAGIGAGGRAAGNMLTAGYLPKEALAGGALTGLAAGMMQRPAAGQKPSSLAVDEMRQTPSGMGKMLSEFRPGEQAINPETGDAYAPAGQPGAAGTASSGSPLKTLGQLAALSSLAGARPPAAQQAVQQLTPAQQEYFNRPSIQWDWNRMQADANTRNMSLAQFMATNWPQVTSGAYNVQQAAAAPAAPAEQPRGYAEGGCAGKGYAAGGLGAAARLMRGGGSGRDDTIPARLSDGEYVMDAETVALLGDGSTKAGAARLDEMRAQLRRHKGRALARGKFSPNAKAPTNYLKGA